MYLCRQEIKGCYKKLRSYPMNLEQVMLFRDYPNRNHYGYGQVYLY